MHNHLANFLKATKISGVAHIDALYRLRGAVFCDFWFLAQKSAIFAKNGLIS